MEYKNPVTYLGGDSSSANSSTLKTIPFPGKPLKIGSRGSDVLVLQTKLAEVGYTITADAPSVYGEQTEKTIKLYQELNRLPITGVADLSTWSELFGPTLPDIPASQRTASLGDYVLKASVSYSLDGASQLSITYLDPGFQQLAANHFQVRRKIMYQGRQFEIASMEVQQSQGGSPQVNIEARSAAIQAMKRDKTPEAYGGMKHSDFAKMIAGRYGLTPVVEDTQKVQTIVKGRNSSADESVWSVLRRAANDEQFVCFETENNLVFCTQESLLGALGIVSLRWPPNDAGGRSILMSIPQLRRSDDDPLGASGSASVDRAYGVQIRPGMTASLSGVPTFDGLYLITEVRYDENVPDPVEIFFKTTPKKDANSSSGSGTGSPPYQFSPTDLDNARMNNKIAQLAKPGSKIFSSGL